MKWKEVLDSPTLRQPIHGFVHVSATRFDDHNSNTLITTHRGRISLLRHGVTADRHAVQGHDLQPVVCLVTHTSIERLITWVM